MHSYGEGSRLVAHGVERESGSRRCVLPWNPSLLFVSSFVHSTVYPLFSSLLFHTMSIPSTLITGTIAYLVFGIVLVGVIFSMRSIGKLNKDDAA